MGKISNCGHDENAKDAGGHYHQGAAGDQTGDEYTVKDWYDYHPWDYVLRYKNTTIANMISNLAIAAANNNNIGYDQDERLTFWQELKKVEYNPDLITNKCEADCSSSTCAIVKAVGYLKKNKDLQNISEDLNTGSMLEAFKAAGFEPLSDTKYLKSDDHLIKGDILLNTNHHTCIYVGDAKVAPDSSLLENVKFSLTIDKPIESTSVNILLVQNNTDKSGEQTLGSFILNGYRSTVHIATENIDNKIENKNNKNNDNKDNNKDDDKIKEYEPYIYDGKKWQKYIITIMEEKEDKKKKEERFRYIYNKIENNQGG